MSKEGRALTATADVHLKRYRLPPRTREHQYLGGAGAGRARDFLP